MLIAKGDHVRFNYCRFGRTIEMYGLIERLGRQYAFIVVDGRPDKHVAILFNDVLEVVK